MKRFKKVLQVVFAFIILIGTATVTTSTVDARGVYSTVAVGDTNIITYDDVNPANSMTQQRYRWKTKKVGKATYHSIHVISRYKSERQATDIFLYKKYPDGSQKIVRRYNLLSTKKEKVAVTVKSKTTTKGTYFYTVRTTFPYFGHDFAADVYGNTEYIVVK